MAGKPTIVSELANDYCQRFPKTPSKTLARKMYNENVEAFSTMNAAYLAIRQKRGAMGKYHRKYTTNPRPHGKSGWKPECPPSFAEEWTPVVLDGPCRVLSLSDTHIPYHDKAAIEAAVAHGRKMKCNAVLLNGDFGDFYRVSRWQQNPKMRMLREETDAMKEALAWLKDRFPKARRLYKLGNHDERWDHFIWQKAPELWDMENVQLHNILEFDKYGFERVDDQPVLAGKLPILHGHEVGKSGIAAPVNPARGLFLRTMHTALIGHLHRTSTHCESDMFLSEVATYSQGCLCDMRPKYARINRWNLGFAVIDVAKNGEFDMHNMRLSSDYKVRAA